MSAVLGIDMGGTFIDVVIAHGGRIDVAKYPSTPDDPARGLFEALADLIDGGRLDAAGVRRVVHGSTVATNALLEGAWARTALLATAGFRDVLEIGRQVRSELYDLSIDRPAPIVPRDLRLEVPERISADGEVLVALDADAVEGMASELSNAGVESVAIAFLFSFHAPDHERRAKDLLSKTLDIPVTLSSDVLAEFREYERTSTTVVCAALRPVIEGYLGRLEESAKAIGLPHAWQIMQSSGTVTGARRAAAEPARVVLSGPAAGVEGARAVGRLAGEDDLITLDMGGTSCDVAVIRQGRIERISAGEIGGFPIGLRMTDIHTIGAGGGSVAWLDTGGALRVGPQSAGADPGPACYGRGGVEPTVTDAHVVLGHLPVDRPIGGLEHLRMMDAREAVEAVARPMSSTVERAALGILEVANASMVRAIRVMTVERGIDPRSFALLAFGGAGPLHAIDLARRMSIPRVVVPATAGVLSALGLVGAEAGRDGSRSILRRLADIDLREVNRMLCELAERGRGSLVKEGVPEAAIRTRISADVRYVGQSHELTVPVELDATGEVGAGSLDALATALHEAHQERFGHSRPEQAIEWVTIRVHLSGPAGASESTWRPSEDRVSGRIAAWFGEEGPVDVPLVDRRCVAPGDEIVSPAIYVGDDATLVLPPDVSGRCTEHGTLVLEIP